MIELTHHPLGMEDSRGNKVEVMRGGCAGVCAPARPPPAIAARNGAIGPAGAWTGRRQTHLPQ